MTGNFTAKTFGRVVFLMSLTMPLACGSGGGNERIKRIGLKPIEVRDSKAGSGKNEIEPEEETETTDPQDSVAAFALTLHPSLKEYCGTCHAKAQPPLFAQDDKKAAHDSLIETSKVDFKNVDQSRVVLRMKENHNCPDGDCAKAVTAFTDGINAWVEKINAKDDGAPALPLTGVKKFGDAVDSILKNTNPPGVIYLEAEKGTLKAPMVGMAAENAVGGMYIHTPMGSGNQNNVATATTQLTLGTVTYDFEVTVAGDYQVMGRVGSPIATTNGFYVRMDGGPLQTWQFPESGDELIWDKADPVVGDGTPISFNLPVGTHTMEIRQRRERARIDAIVLANDPSFTGDSASPGDENVKKLTYDIGDLSGVPGAKLTVIVGDYSSNAYIFRSPTIELPSGSKIKVKNLKLYINGKYLPQHATYTIVDTEVSEPEQVLSKAALVALKDKGSDTDEFSFEFEILQKVP